MKKSVNGFFAPLLIFICMFFYSLGVKSKNINVLCESFNGGTAFCTFVETDKETICEAIGNGLGQCNSEDGETKLECISLSRDFGASGLQLSCQRESSTGFDNAFD